MMYRTCGISRWKGIFGRCENTGESFIMIFLRQLGLRGLFSLAVFLYEVLSSSYARLKSFFLNVSFPPVVFVLLWNSLSQHFTKGSLISYVEFKPFSGKNETCVRAPTWLSRFNKNHHSRHFTGGNFSLIPIQDIRSHRKLPPVPA